MQRAFAEALSNFRSLIVRYNETPSQGGKGGGGALLLSPRSAAAAARLAASSPTTASGEGGGRESLLFHICAIDINAPEFAPRGGRAEGPGEEGMKRLTVEGGREGAAEEA